MQVPAQQLEDYLVRKEINQRKEKSLQKKKILAVAVAIIATIGVIMYFRSFSQSSMELDNEPDTLAIIAGTLPKGFRKTKTGGSKYGAALGGALAKYSKMRRGLLLGSRLNRASASNSRLPKALAE